MSKPSYYSNIYWHFTGGPVSKNDKVVWHHYRCLKDVKNNSKLREPKDALNNLKSIINNQLLKATCTELIANSVETKEFCSVCDIPLNDLTYHRKYYGEYAIGFSADKIHKYFHPVLYLDPFYSKIINTGKEASRSDKEVSLWELLGIQRENSLMNFVKITNFASDYDHSFYGEREWRCIEDFCFEKEEVEAIIVPKEHIEEINRYIKEKGYHNISVMSWDLIDNI